MTALHERRRPSRGDPGVSRDISERRRAQTALEESEKRYRLLAENATDIIWITDFNLRAIYINPAVTRIRGFSVEEAMAQTPEEALTPASVEVARRALAEELEESAGGPAPLADAGAGAHLQGRLHSLARDHGDGPVRRTGPGGAVSGGLARYQRAKAGRGSAARGQGGAGKPGRTPYAAGQRLRAHLPRADGPPSGGRWQVRQGDCGRIGHQRSHGQQAPGQYPAQDGRRQPHRGRACGPSGKDCWTSAEGSCRAMLNIRYKTTW